MSRYQGIPSEIGERRPEGSEFADAEVENERSVEEAIVILDGLYEKMRNVSLEHRNAITGLLAATGTILRAELRSRSSNEQDFQLDQNARELLSQSLAEFGLKIGEF